jgi:hypothetical protein
MTKDEIDTERDRQVDLHDANDDGTGSAYFGFGWDACYEFLKKNDVDMAAIFLPVNCPECGHQVDNYFDHVDKDCHRD